MPRQSSEQKIQKAALTLFSTQGRTDITVCELAEVAGVSRGTIYNHHLRQDVLFEDISAHLGKEMHLRIQKTLKLETNPAIRLTQAIRMYIRRAAEEPEWGAFICKFIFNHQNFIGIWESLDSPTPDIVDGLRHQLYQFRMDQLLSASSLVVGQTLMSIHLVLSQRVTWQVAGQDTAEFILRAFGLSHDEARYIATLELRTLL